MTYEKPTKFARSARRHRIGRTHAYFVMEHTQAHVTESEHYWVGVDDRGVELEILAVERPDCLLVIHVMPTQYRRRRR